jgi:hypothetical protein
MIIKLKYVTNGYIEQEQAIKHKYLKYFFIYHG